ncbi:hypothetical protein HYE69_05780 [Staphylococcus sp. GSSP0090]|nr:hypothetical protein [Staphylococcus sp. GSSP0090]
MKKIIIATFAMGLLVLLASCSNETPENNKTEEKSVSTDNTSNSDKDKSENHNDNKQNEQNTEQQTTNTNSNERNQSDQAENDSTNEDQGILNQYNNEEIEYARVWDQLGPMKNNMDGMNTLYVKKLPKGSKVNPQAEDSAVYKEDVVKLEAPMRAGGSVTYSSNGDGTINVYKKVPYNWRDSSSDANMKEATTQAIEENVETVTVNQGDDQTIADLAEKIKYSN